MEQSHHIRLSGHAKTIPLTAAAHERLLRYLASARRELISDPDSDETIRDVEASLGEQLQGLVDASGEPADEKQMSQLLAEAGAVAVQDASRGGLPGRPRGSFWCRINQGKWFGGLCLGIAARGDFRVDWVRTIAIFLALVTGGLIGIVYLALMLFVPRVETVDEYGKLRDTPEAEAV